MESARREADRNPEAAFALAYDCARKSATALLAQQGLRTKGVGHHVAIEEVVKAQFGGPFRDFGDLRRRRAEVEYPIYPGGVLTASEASEAISAAEGILDAASALLPRLSPYR